MTKCRITWNECKDAKTERIRFNLINNIHQQALKCVCVSGGILVEKEGLNLRGKAHCEL